MVTRFPRSQPASNPLVINEPVSQQTVPCLQQSDKTIVVNPQMYEQLKQLFSQPSTSMIQPPLASVCDHPHCSKTFCQHSVNPPQPHGTPEDHGRINMIKFVPAKDDSQASYKTVKFFNPHEELLLQTVTPSTSRGLGYVQSGENPDYRRNPIDKIPSRIEIPSDSEIIAFLKMFKGIGPYDAEDP